MATNTKMLELTFNVEGGRSMILSIPSPKEDLTLATVKEKAALIIPVLESSSGAPVTSLKSAKIVETSATVLEQGFGVTGIPPSGIAPFRHPERRETSYVR